MNIQKRLNKILSSYSQINAFTYVEVITALLIISLLAGLLYFSYAICVKQINKSNVSLHDSIDRLNTDSLIRSNIESVIIPYWIKDYDYSFSKNEINLSWVNGIKTNKTIIISDNYEILNVSPIGKNKKKIEGLIVEYRVNNQVYEIKALFASKTYGEISL